MKQFSILFFLASILLVASCGRKSVVRISIDNQSEIKDSIVVRNLITERLILILSYDGPDALISINEPMIVSFSIQLNPDNYLPLSILSPGQDKLIEIDPSGKIRSNCLADSLLHYLFLSNNSFIAENQNFIFRAEDPKDVYRLFNSLIIKRNSIINLNKRNLTSAERNILAFQNSARVYSFLFYYGRLIRNLDPNHPFWGFIDNIDNNSRYNKTLPHNLLYKLEIEYLKTYGELESISDFIDFIHASTGSSDLANYLTAIYLEEIISNPGYWQRHYALFDSVALLRILEEQKENPYSEIYAEVAENYFASQKGLEAYNFTAKDTNNQTVKLSDFLGKYVLIDVWATWCSPCIAQKPHFYELATRFKENDNIQFVAISVDSSIELWQNFLSRKNNQAEEVLELFMPAEIRAEFMRRYSISFLPKYILIDREGKIIDANAPKPSEELGVTLNRLLSIN